MHCNTHYQLSHQPTCFKESFKKKASLVSHLTELTDFLITFYFSKMKHKSMIMFVSAVATCKILANLNKIEKWFSCFLVWLCAFQLIYHHNL